MKDSKSNVDLEVHFDFFRGTAVCSQLEGMDHGFNRVRNIMLSSPSAGLNWYGALEANLDDEIHCSATSLHSPGNIYPTNAMTSGWMVSWSPRPNRLLKSTSKSSTQLFLGLVNAAMCQIVEVHSS